MISRSGVYRIDAPEETQCTYLHTGVYEVTVQRGEAHFRNVLTGSGAFERVSMMNTFEKQGRILCTLLRADIARTSQEREAA
jgi:hypothetical protein